MTKLTKTQHSILSSAFGDPLGLAACPASLKPAPASKMSKFFAENQLAKEIRAKAEYPIWREDDEGRRYALKILKAGRAAIAASEDAGSEVIDKGGAPSKPVTDGAATSTAQVGLGSKSQLIIGLMQRPDGATIEDLIAATGWLPHTTRAALTGLRKKGILIDRQPAEQGRASVYRISAGTSRQAA